MIKEILFLTIAILSIAQSQDIPFSEPTSVNFNHALELSTGLFVPMFDETVYQNASLSIDKAHHSLEFKITREGQLAVFIAFNETYMKNITNLSDFASVSDEVLVRNLLATNIAKIWDHSFYNPTLDDTTIAGFPARAFTKILENDVTFATYLIDMGEKGRIGTILRVDSELRSEWEGQFAALLSNLSTESDLPTRYAPKLNLTMATGESFTEANTSIELIVIDIESINRVQLLISQGLFEPLIVIGMSQRLELGNKSYSLDTQSDFFKSSLNLPILIEDKPWIAQYGTNPSGSLALENDGKTLKGTFKFFFGFTQLFDLGSFTMHQRDEVAKAPELPDTMVATGSFEHIPISDEVKAFLMDQEN